MYELSHPWVLLACLFPLIIMFVLPALNIQYQTALKVPFFQLMRQNQADKWQLASYVWLKHWWGIWLLLVLSLSGPRWVAAPTPIGLDTHHVMMVLDISGSMGLKDMPTKYGLSSRWQVVKTSAWDFIEHRKADRLGLVLFGERAYLFAPLTHDIQTLHERLNDAGVGMAGQATAIGDAIGLGIKHLQKTPNQARVMILLTDGVSNAGILSPLKAARLAATEGIKIYVIGLGPVAGKGLAGVFWQMQHANDLDENSLMKIAKLTNGQYYRASDETALKKIYQAIDALEPVQHERLDLRPEKSYFYWPLSLAMFWIIFLFVRQIYQDWSKK